jgi:hypothetical protein
MSIDARLSTGLPAHPKTKKLIRRCGEAGAWHLVCLILWARANRPDGDLAGMSSAEIEAAAGWAGSTGAFSRALNESGFFETGTLAAGFWAPDRSAMARFGRICSKTWKRIRLAIFNRDGWRCTYCGNTSGPFECDHVVPISRGGSNDPENLTTACKPCNRSKRAKLVGEWRAA